MTNHAEESQHLYPGDTPPIGDDDPEISYDSARMRFKEEFA